MKVESLSCMMFRSYPIRVKDAHTHTLSLCMKRWELSSTAVHPIEIDHIHRLNQHIQRVIVVVNRCSSTFYPRDIYHRLMKLSCTPFVWWAWSSLPCVHQKLILIRRSFPKSHLRTPPFLYLWKPWDAGHSIRTAMELLYFIALVPHLQLPVDRISRMVICAAFRNVFEQCAQFISSSVSIYLHVLSIWISGCLRASLCAPTSAVSIGRLCDNLFSSIRRIHVVDELSFLPLPPTVCSLCERPPEKSNI